MPEELTLWYERKQREHDAWVNEIVKQERGCRNWRPTSFWTKLWVFLVVVAVFGLFIFSV